MTNSLNDTQPIPTRRTLVSPLLDLLRATLAEHSEVTLRAVSTEDSEHAAAVGYVRSSERAIGLPDQPDDVAYLTRLVVCLYSLSLGTDRMDPRRRESAQWFVDDATRRTLAAMGEVAR